MYTWIEIPENELKEMFMNYSVTAEKMYVHINTIRKRIDKVNDLVKIDWEDHVDRLRSYCSYFLVARFECYSFCRSFLW